MGSRFFDDIRPTSAARLSHEAHRRVPRHRRAFGKITPFRNRRRQHERGHGERATEVYDRTTGTCNRIERTHQRRGLIQILQCFRIRMDSHTRGSCKRTCFAPIVIVLQTDKLRVRYAQQRRELSLRDAAQRPACVVQSAAPCEPDYMPGVSVPEALTPLANPRRVRDEIAGTLRKRSSVRPEKPRQAARVDLGRDARVPRDRGIG